MKLKFKKKRHNKKHDRGKPGERGASSVVVAT
jgi:hypothetical protein